MHQIAGAIARIFNFRAEEFLFMAVIPDMMKYTAEIKPNIA